ncbi:MAG: cupin domain-containing protein [Burkholderiaceae bacterium]
MQLGTTAIVLLAAAILFDSAAAQTTQAQPTTARTVVASSKLATVSDVPIYFKAVQVTIPPGESSSVTAGNGMLYQISGSTAVSLDGDTKELTGGEGLFIASGRKALLKAAPGEPSIFIHFLIVPVTDLDQPVETAPAIVQELYRTAASIPDLKPGSYDVNLTRITFPTRMPSNPPHHRTGAALYRVLAGSGANTVEGKTDVKGPGSFIYEPSTLVHQWGNAGDEPFTFLVFNINPEGTAAVVPAAR